MSTTPSFWAWFNGQLIQIQNSETSTQFQTANIKIDETARLRLELKKAKAEIEFLKKAAAYFAKTP